MKFGISLEIRNRLPADLSAKALATVGALAQAGKLKIAFFALLLLLSIAKNADAAIIGKPPTNLGLVGYWNFNEGTGSYAGDSSGKNNTGTLTNGPTWVDGKRGKALSFDGSNDYVDLGVSPQLTPNDITISVWVRADNLNLAEWNGIISNMTSWGTGFGLQMGTRQGIAAMISGAYLNANIVIASSTWYHITATHDSSTNLNVLYVNGNQVNSVVRAVSYEANAKTYIGVFYTSPSLFFPGLIDDVRVYNRALSAGEVRALYNSGAAKIKKTATGNPVIARLLTSGLGSAGTSHVTASIAPDPNTLILAFVHTYGDASVEAGDVTTLSGNGLTWVPVMTNVNYGGWNTYAVFRAMGASPSPGAVTITNTYSIHPLWSIVEFRNVDTSGTDGSGAIVQSGATASYGASSVTHTLGTFSGTSNATIGSVARSNVATPTAGSGFTLIGGTSGNNSTLQPEWKAVNDTTVDMSFDSNHTNYMWAAEIKAKPPEAKFAPPSNTGLVGYWSFDDGAGFSATDFSGKNNTGILVNGPTWVDGKRGKALNFDGSNDQVVIGDRVEPKNISVAAWVYSRSTSGRIVSKYGQVGVDNQYELLANGSVYTFQVSDINENQDQCNSTVSPQTDRWVYLVGTYNGSSCTLYVNAQDVTNAVLTAANNNINNTATPLRIGIRGSDGVGTPFNGLIDEVRIYNRALSASEIQALYNSR